MSIWEQIEETRQDLLSYSPEDYGLYSTIQEYLTAASLCAAARQWDVALRHVMAAQDLLRLSED